MRFSITLLVALVVGCSSAPTPGVLPAEPEPDSAAAAGLAGHVMAPVTLFLIRGRLRVTVDVGDDSHTAYALLYDGGVRTTDVPTLRSLQGATNIVHESWRADEDADDVLAQAIARGPFQTDAPYTELHFTAPEASESAPQVTVEWNAGGRDRSITADAAIDTSATDAVVRIGPIDLTQVWTGTEQRDVTRSLGARGGSLRAELELVVSSDSRRAGVGARAPATTAIGDDDPRPLWEEHPIRSGAASRTGTSNGGASNDLARELEGGLTPEFVERTGR